ncbi:glutathione S-transferase D7-like [Drosophila eugracilis]|uniref:glutathione S-transferase D7-like n=1 Tax=Drosophila eugracilis TaxID=29029 RepID=UPI001BDACFA3|nr:glutathione S-transferase D7-like [Drosophila eugracilis]
MPTMDFYNMPGSPSSLAVEMVAKAVGVELNNKVVNILEGEQLKPEYVKINPQQTVPTLVDNGFVLWEPRAIVVYLVEKYGKPGSPLYPNDPQKRALINQRLFFDMGVLFEALTKYFSPYFRTGKLGDQQELDAVNKALGFLNTFLEGEDFLAGSQFSVADIVILASISLFELIPFDLKKFPNVERWYKNAPKVAPGWEENVQSLKQAQKFLEAKLAGNK